MAKKQKARAKAERTRRRVVKRRFSRLIEFGLIIGVLFLEIIIGRMPDSPEWFGTPLYYGLLFGILFIGFWVLWVFFDTSDKTDIDELEEKMEQLFLKQTQATKMQTRAINKLTKSINILVQEIRTDRNYKDE